MKVCVFIILFLWQCVSFAQDTPDQPLVPHLKINEVTFYFGETYRGQRLHKTFPFRNDGQGPLVISNIHSSCGCLNAAVYAKDGKTPQDTFSPEDEGFVSVDLDTAGFQGNIVRKLTFDTNMPVASPTVVITLSAHVNQEIESVPPMLYLGKMDKNQVKKFRFKVNLLGRAKFHSPHVLNLAEDLKQQLKNSSLTRSNRSEILSNYGPLKVFGVDSSNPNIKATLLDTNEEQNPTIEVSFVPPLPIGPFNSQLTIWNNSDYYKDYKFPIVGEVTGRVNQTAKYVEFGVVSPQKSSERVIVYSSSLKNFDITAVKVNLKQTSNSKEIKESDIFIIKKEKILWNDPAAGKQLEAYRLHFKLGYPKQTSALLSSGVNISGHFVVKTNDPDYKEIFVPFFGILRNVEP